MVQVQCNMGSTIKSLSLASWLESLSYLDVEVDEENHKCEHVAGLEK